MWTNFTVKNFRCFSGMSIHPLARVNLIAGKNNTGKTALLEAIFLHQDPLNVTKIFEVARLRGFPGTEKYHEQLARWLFLGRYTYPIGAEFYSQNEKGKIFCSRLWLVEAAQMMERFEEVEKNLQKSLVKEMWDIERPRLVVEIEEEGKRFAAGAIYQGSGWAGFNRKPSTPLAVFLGARFSLDELNVAHFGTIEQEKRQEEILPALRHLEPRLTKLALIPLAGRTIIHGDVGLPQMVPVQFMGEGVQRLLSIVLAIAVPKHGMVLIDEIENGLHYSVMVDVWKAIAEAARQADVQVFATTHSWECIQAAHRAFKESGPYELRYHRLDRDGEGIVVKSLDEALLERVQYTDLEIR